MSLLRWLWSILERDGDRERRNVELTRLTLRSEQAEARSARIRAEQERLVTALRNTVQAMRHDPICRPVVEALEQRLAAQTQAAP